MNMHIHRCMYVPYLFFFTEQLSEKRTSKWQWILNDFDASCFGETIMLLLDQIWSKLYTPQVKDLLVHSFYENEYNGETW